MGTSTKDQRTTQGYFYLQRKSWTFLINDVFRLIVALIAVTATKEQTLRGWHDGEGNKKEEEIFGCRGNRKNDVWDEIFSYAVMIRDGVQ